MAGKRLVVAASILLFFAISGISYAAQEGGSVLLPEETIRKIFNTLEDIDKRQKTMESKTMERLDRIISGLEEMKKDLELIRKRSFR